MRIRVTALLAIVAFAISATPAFAHGSAAEPTVKAKKACSLKKKAKCKKAKISKQKFGKQNLSGSDLSGAVITGTTFTGTNLSNVNLSGAKLTNVTFKNVNLGGASLEGAKLVNVTMDHVDASQGSSARSGCELPIQSDETTLCSKQGLNADNASLANTTVYSAQLPRSTWRHAIFNGTKFYSPNFSYARFDGAEFQQGSVITGVNLTSQHDPKPDIDWAWVDYARFDNSNGLRLVYAAGANTSFLGATNAVISLNSKLTKARGLLGGNTISVVPATGTSVVPTSIQIKETGYWRIGNLCVAATTCSYTAANGMPAEINIASATALDVTAPGFTCTQSGSAGAFVSTCSTSSLVIGEAVAVTYATPTAPPVTKTVTVNVAPFALDRIAIQTMSASGTILTTKECLGQMTCSTAVVAGSTVVVAFSASSPDGAWLVVQYPDGTTDTPPRPLPISDWGSRSFVASADTTLEVSIS